MKKISQRAALRMRKELRRLESERRASLNRWCAAWPGGIQVGDVNVGSESRVYVGIDFAQKFGCVVVCKLDGGSITFHAIKNPKI